MDEWTVLAMKQIAMSTLQLTELQHRGPWRALLNVLQLPEVGFLSPGPLPILSGG